MSAARRLAAGRLVSLTGGSAAYIALIAAIYERTGSARWISAALVVGVVGSVVGAPAAGYLGDRFERRAVMIGADVAAAVVSFAMVFATEPAVLVALFGLAAVVTSPFAPASAAALPNLVEGDAVVRANALVATTTSLGYLLGPLLGGLLLGAGASPSAVFAMDAVTFVVSAVLVASIRHPFGSGRGTELHPGVLAGVRFVRRDRVLRLLVLASMSSLFGMGMVNVAAYPLSLRLDGGTEGYGAMEALLGGGGLVGVALAGRLLIVSRAPAILSAAFAASSVGLAVASLAPTLLVALAGVALAGGGRGLGEVADTTLVQSRAHDAVRSRVFAAQDGAAHVAFTAAMLAGGVLVEATGPRGAVATAAACALAAAFVALGMRRADR